MNGPLIGRIAAGALGAYVLVCLVLAFLWSYEPDLFDVEARATARAEALGRQRVTGFTTTSTLIDIADTLLDKRGGYLSNDIFPPGVLLDNTPNWEFGVLVQVRDMARVMRNDLSRSQSQSAENPDLANAEGKFFFDNSSWLFPQSEDEYRDGIRLLERYLRQMSDPTRQDAQFYARADNLRAWLQTVETRLGSLSERLSSAVGKRQLDMGLAGDPVAQQATPSAEESDVKTPWLEIDDVFYEARGQTWALIHLLRAAETDFGDVLRNKNAMISMRQIIRDLEPTQDTLWSPMVLNGDGLGVLANHSLVMASHVARANAAIIDLRNLLSEG
ncbi:MAG TPA: DUF2333 family protein [Pseudomonadales bacterium]|nr:DUF2333 family protein [Pseudomonadales bacterium]